jgi:hypothetical protein
MAFCTRHFEDVVCFSEDARLKLCVPLKAWNVTTYREDSYWEFMTMQFRYHELRTCPIGDHNKGKWLYVLRSEAEACAVKYHGSKEKLVAAQQAKADREAKAAATRVVSTKKREQEFKALVDEVGVDLKWLGDKKGERASKALSKGEKYVNCGGNPMVAVHELCTVTFLLSYTPYCDDLGRLSAYTKGALESCALMQEIALRGLTHDGQLPGWWPWLEWTRSTHKFALPNFKEGVRTMLLVNNRNSKLKGLPFLHSEVMEAFIKAYAAAVVSNCPKLN